MPNSISLTHKFFKQDLCVDLEFSWNVNLIYLIEKWNSLFVDDAVTSFTGDASNIRWCGRKQLSRLYNLKKT